MIKKRLYRVLLVAMLVLSGCKEKTVIPDETLADIFHDAKLASRVINMTANFGEGWLIPAELASFAESGVYNAISLQPFGCIANHVISKGIEKKFKNVYPQMNLLFLDFDSSTSEANVFNRLHFMVENARQTNKHKK